MWTWFVVPYLKNDYYYYYYSTTTATRKTIAKGTSGVNRLGVVNFSPRSFGYMWLKLTALAES